MPGRPTWLLRHRLLVMFLTRLRWTMDATIMTFKQMFPEVCDKGAGNPTRKLIGHNKTSIEYCQKTLLAHGAYDLDTFWVNPIQGKLGYLLGLHDLGYCSSEIARRIEDRFPTLLWPTGFTHEVAVEIAVITYHEYSMYSGHASLINKYPDPAAFVPSWVMKCFENGFAPEFIQGPAADMAGNPLAPITFDEVIFILTRFVPQFADYWRSNDVFLPNPAIMVSNQDFALQ